MPAPPHASVLFFEGKPRAFSREVQWRFFEDEGSGETDADRKHERVQARGRNWRALGGDMPWSVVSHESNQPDRSTEINVHGHG